MTSKNWKFKKILIVSLSSLIFLNGCGMLPDSFSMSAPKQQYNKAYDSNADLRSTEERLNSLEQEANDWKQAKPAINRLTELESDLSFIIEQIERIETGPKIENINTHVSRINEDKKGAPELVSLMESTQINTNLPSSLQPKEQKFSQARADMQPNIQNNKFSSSNSNADSPSRRVVTFNANQIEGNSNVDVRAAAPLAKFRGLNEVSSFEAQQDCALSDIKSGKGYAIHLASFKNKAIAVNTLKKFYNENSQIVCGKMPIIKDVVVKEQSFYSLRLGPYLDKKDAEKSCRQVREYQSYCGITNFEGGEVKI
jgi:cell division septation protein DedD